MRALAVRVVLGLLLLTACRIEDRTPTGSRRDDQSIRAVVATYYRSLTARDWPATRSLFSDSAQVLVRTVGAVGWSRYTDAEGFHLDLVRQASTRDPGRDEVLVARIDVRQEGDLAAVWVMARHHVDETDRPEARSADHFILRRMDGAWRIVAYYSTPVSDRPVR